YFEYHCTLDCGIPSITLQGTKEDYLSIYQRLDKLEEFGREPKAFAQLLRPVIKRFAEAFDAVEEGKTPDPDFWGRICHYHSGGSGPDLMSGWATAFCVWNKKGKWQGGDINLIDKPVVEGDKSGFGRAIIDGLRYPWIKTEELPPGICEVDVKLNDNGLELDCMMVAGHIGNTISATGSEAIMNTLQPQSEWFMFDVGKHITFKIADHDAKEFNWYGRRGEVNALQALPQIWRPTDSHVRELLQSSFRPSSSFNPNDSGFVNTVVQAYSRHHHLIIRPDDIWISILSQVNFYVNANAEDLRSKFVAHEGKKEIHIEVTGTRYTVDFGQIAEQFGARLKENILDPSLHEWIIPNYTTTTPNDKVICSVMMMATLKAYFDYSCSIDCGIPSITLQGTKEDYLSIYQRLDKLEEFGPEPTAFARLLRPVIKQFTAAFHAVEEGKTPDPDFWGRICHYHSGGSGPSYISGWLSVFCVWNKKGKWQGGNIDLIDEPVPEADKLRYERERWGPPPPLVVDGLRYPCIDTGDIPPGTCEVDIKLNDNGVEMDCSMIAGHIGNVVSARDPEGVMDTLQPQADWFMFVKEDRPPPDYEAMFRDLRS
ncbi:hypothetical protein CPB86DRAFT_710916, partial [Serendipita vermifera]